MHGRPTSEVFAISFIPTKTSTEFLFDLIKKFAVLPLGRTEIILNLEICLSNSRKL